MIRINLLPEEYRRGQRLSTKVFAAALGGVIMVCAAFGYFGMIYFGELGELQARHRIIAEDLQRKLQQAAYYDKLESQRKDYLQRVQTIQDIGKSRRLWTEFMDQLIDVVNNNGDTERHLAWFDSITIKEDRNGPSILLPGAVQGSEIARVANLHEDIESSPFARDIATKSDPGGKLELDKNREPPESFGFTLKVNFLPPAKWAKNQPKKDGQEKAGDDNGNRKR